MHEAGIAAQIIEVAAAEAERNSGAAIERIGVRVGALTGVVAEALEFAFEALRVDTPAVRATLVVERIPLTGYCDACAATIEVLGEVSLLCPRCETPLSVLTGRELDVAWIELEEPCNVSPSNERS
jgi:hydrogenase nickel incorporation protein HypA/HybF